jgi:type III secretion protein Q
VAIGDQLGVRIVRMGLGVASGSAGVVAASTGLTPGLSS